MKSVRLESDFALRSQFAGTINAHSFLKPKHPRSNPRSTSSSSSTSFRRQTISGATPILLLRLRPPRVAGSAHKSYRRINYSSLTSVAKIFVETNQSSTACSPRLGESRPQGICFPLGRFPYHHSTSHGSGKRSDPHASLVTLTAMLLSVWNTGTCAHSTQFPNLVLSDMIYVSSRPEFNT